MPSGPSDVSVSDHRLDGASQAATLLLRGRGEVSSGQHVLRPRRPVQLAELLPSQGIQLVGQFGVGTDRRRHPVVERRRSSYNLARPRMQGVAPRGDRSA
jgi:hypothetical protein